MNKTGVFRNLSSRQYSDLKESLALVTILVAGADGEIDEQELNWAEKLAKIRTYAEPEELTDFYEDVEKSFTEQVDSFMQELPGQTDARQRAISARLTQLNDILPLLENKIAFELYKGLKSFAHHIAKASGGFLRFGSVSKEEKKWIDLPMIHPIIREEAEGDE